MQTFQFRYIDGTPATGSFSVIPNSYPLSNGQAVVRADPLTYSGSPQTVSLVPNTYKVECNTTKAASTWYFSGTTPNAADSIVSGSVYSGSLATVLFNFVDSGLNQLSASRITIQPVNKNVGWAGSFVLGDFLTFNSGDFNTNTFTVSLVPQPYTVTVYGQKKNTSFTVLPSGSCTASMCIVSTKNVAASITPQNAALYTYPASVIDGKLNALATGSLISGFLYPVTASSAVSASNAHTASVLSGPSASIDCSGNARLGNGTAIFNSDGTVYMAGGAVAINAAGDLGLTNGGIYSDRFVFGELEQLKVDVNGNVDTSGNIHVGGNLSVDAPVDVGALQIIELADYNPSLLINRNGGYVNVSDIRTDGSSITCSLQGTASFAMSASLASKASSVAASNVVGTVNSASCAVTASYVASSGVVGTVASALYAYTAGTANVANALAPNSSITASGLLVHNEAETVVNAVCNGTLTAVYNNGFDTRLEGVGTNFTQELGSGVVYDLSNPSNAWAVSWVENDTTLWVTDPDGQCNFKGVMFGFSGSRHINADLEVNVTGVATSLPIVSTSTLNASGICINNLSVVSTSATPESHTCSGTISNTWQNDGLNSRLEGDGTAFTAECKVGGLVYDLYNPSNAYVISSIESDTVLYVRNPYNNDITFWQTPFGYSGYAQQTVTQLEASQNGVKATNLSTNVLYNVNNAADNISFSGTSVDINGDVWHDINLNAIGAVNVNASNGANINSALTINGGLVVTGDGFDDGWGDVYPAHFTLDAAGNMTLAGSLTVGSITAETLTLPPIQGDLNVNGNISTQQTITTNGVVLGIEAVANGNLTTSSPHTILLNGRNSTLPDATTCKGLVFTIKSTDTESLVVFARSGQTIDGASTYTLSAQYKFVTVQSDGHNWYIIGKN